MIFLVVCIAFCMLVFLSLAGYCIWHAHKNGNQRLLMFCMGQKIYPTPTSDELTQWGRSF